ncbi:hypothetical protein ABTW96_33205 [Nocardia beijingensis]|uniref:hypothetical protein n=1 Tax=Nocardia beijingensis TaxID=95162 RepID=UPI00331F92A6
MLGAILATAATGSGIYGLINAGDCDWGDPLTLLPLAAAAVLYVTFVVYERRVSAPLLDPRLLTRRPVAAGAVLMLVATGLLITGFFLGSFYLWQAQGFPRW